MMKYPVHMNMCIILHFWLIWNELNEEFIISPDTMLSFEHKTGNMIMSLATCLWNDLVWS